MRNGEKGDKIWASNVITATVKGNIAPYNGYYHLLSSAPETRRLGVCVCAHVYVCVCAKKKKKRKKLTVSRRLPGVKLECCEED